MQIQKRKDTELKNKILVKIFELISYLKTPTKKKIKVIILVMILNSLCEFTTIGSLIPLIDFALNPNKISNINFLNLLFDFFNIQQDNKFFFIAFVFLFIVTFSGFFRIFAVKLITDYNSTILIELGKKLYRGAVYQDYEFYLKTNSSNLITSLTQQLEQSVGVIGNFLDTIFTILCILGIILSLSFISFKLVFFTLFIISIFYLLSIVSTKKIVNSNGKYVFDTRIKIVKIVQESLGFIRQIILDDSYEFFVDEYNKNNSQFARKVAILKFIQQIPKYLLEIIILLIVAIILIFLNLKQYELTSYIPIFGAFILGLQKLLPLFQKTFNQIYAIREYKDSLFSVVSLLKDAPKVEFDFRNQNKNIYNLKDKIKFDNVSFSYNENKVLQNINCEISKGDVVGIVGKTGAGKSTFVDLLMGLLEPTAGNISIDGKNMNPNLFKEFRLSVSSVPQDYFLLDRSIEENIIFGRNANINYDFLNRIVDFVMLRDFVDSLRYGLKTFVGEDGVRLSGGQKQRVAIARAIYKKHSFLLLDEATSAVDLETESKIIKNILNSNPNLTIVMIAHRLETLKNCDYILEIKDKKLTKHNNLNDYKSIKKQI